ncbi:hypothetical protein [Paracoccus sp. (in: a-proteobacteria)]|uniref:hypothetical protein n=1 Tax=Paracoccus sp. TaxID=267 RepID=UPI002897829C|nr:hypothetical protein [Paracoccus sp. (in: a-proteobacteria)]
MRSPSLFIAASALLLVAACKPEVTALGLACESDAEATVARSSAIAYGVQISPPRLTGVHPLKEADLFEVEMHDADKLGLLASDATGALHSVTCSDALCSLDDAKKVLKACAQEKQCKIIGAVESKTFYPLYLSDDAGGHVCAPRWG